MHKSNIFSSLTHDFGTFFTFSQYNEDFTRNISEGDAYKIVPSKYAAFDIKYTDVISRYDNRVSLSNINIPEPLGNSQADINNKKIGNIFQNYFENCINIFKQQTQSPTFIYDPDIFIHKFWRFFQIFDFVNLTEISDEIPGEEGEYFPEIKYIGDLDIISNNIIDGINYSELYCIIPNEAKRNIYILEDFPERVAPFIINNDNEYISGWNTSSYPEETSNNKVLSHYPIFDNYNNNSYDLDNSRCPIILKNFPEEPTNISNIENAGYIETTDNIFHANTIVIFYDIVVKNSQGEYNVLYKNIPMGVYFTGGFDDSINNYLSNSITKYVNIPEAYNQGTSYGLRISTKMSTIPSFDTSINNIDIITTDLYPEFSKVMEEFSKSYDILSEASNKSTTYINNLKDYLGYFKDKKTNIPYIINVGGNTNNPNNYWFVNGRNTGVQCNSTINMQNQITQLQNELYEFKNTYNEGFNNISTEFLNIFNNISGGVNRITPIDIINDINKSNITYINTYTEICPLYNNEGVNLFKDYNNLKNIPTLDIYNLENANAMFENCYVLEYINMRESVNCKSFKNTFKNCETLKSVTIDFTSLENLNSIDNCIEDIFKNCYLLENIYINNFNIPNNGIELNLRDTKCSVSSLIYILSNIQTKPYVTDSIYSTLTIRLSANLDKDSKEISDILFFVNENKNIYVELINF